VDSQKGNGDGPRSSERRAEVAPGDSVIPSRAPGTLTTFLSLPQDRAYGWDLGRRVVMARAVDAPGEFDPSARLSVP